MASPKEDVIIMRTIMLFVVAFFPSLNENLQKYMAT